MATLGDITLFDSAAHMSGAAFALVEAPPQDFLVEADNSYVELRSGRRDIVVRLSGVSNPKSTLDNGYAVCQRALDLLSIQSQCHLTIRTAALEHTVWWTYDSKTTLRAVRSIPFRLPVIRATATVGNGIEATLSAAPVSHYSAALRYYRLAQITVDLYDAFRNLFLALEHLLSDRFRYTGTGEQRWLNSALMEAGEVTDLGPMTPGINAAERAKWISQRLYATRGRIFHAKVGRKIYLPHDSLEEQLRVRDDGLLLGYLVVRILDSWHQVRGSRTEFSDVAVNAMAEAMWHDARMLASTDTSPLGPDNGGLSHSRFKKAIPLKTVVNKNDCSAGLYRLVGSITEPTAQGLPIVQRVDVVDANAVLVTQTDDSALVLDGVHEFEYVIPTFLYAKWLPPTLANYTQL